ncbi:MAG: DMT family transporter, partial [Ignavibacteria bacterium]|nr:DMT family transporter [Ignavibacteria bacterium]
MIGEISALITAFCWSATSLIFTEAGKRIGVIQLNVTRLVLAVVFLAITIFIVNIQIVLSASQTYALILSGIIGLVIGDTFLFYAFDIIGPRKSMMIMSGVPAVSALLAFIFLGEVLSFMSVV